MNRAAMAFGASTLALIVAGVLLAQPGAIVVPADKAIIVVYTTADATVSVGGQVSAQKGPERRFITPTLTAGDSYSYEIVATWTDKGAPKQETRTVSFHAGETKTVNFLQPATGSDKKTTDKDKKPDTDKKTTDKDKKPDTDKKNDKKPEDKKTEKKTAEVWTDTKDPTLPADFRIQGEYVSDAKERPMGCQVIALGGGQFQAVVLPGGLPGAGWDGKNKSLMQGHLEGDRAMFTPATGKRKYLAGPPAEFAATLKFPPVGQKDLSGTADGKQMTITDAGATFTLKKTIRESPTLALNVTFPTVLFDGTNTAEWSGGRLDKERGILNTDGHDITTKRRFSNYSVHLEFMLPYRPAARGQGRGNSGFSQVMQYEVQILDSFGLEGKDNECGGIYSRIAPKVNMCLPPLQWQTYDIDFTNAVPDPADPKKVAKRSRITCKLNGVVIHDNVELPGPTGGAWNQPEGTPGPLLLQGHGNPLQFKNIWIVEKK
jgi:uncharacterized protein (TIGR03000 family)